MVLRDTAALRALRLRDYHPLWCSFPGYFGFSVQIAVCGPYNPNAAETTLVWAIPRSLATTWGVTRHGCPCRMIAHAIVFLSSGYLDVSVPRVGSPALCIQTGVTGLQPAGFSHSDIRGSKGVCPSPRLIAAYHVLHRLLVPRHPPYALTNFTSATRLVSAFLKRAARRLHRFYTRYSDSRWFLLDRTNSSTRNSSTNLSFDSTTAISMSKNASTSTKLIDPPPEALASNALPEWYPGKQRTP